MTTSSQTKRHPPARKGLRIRGSRGNPEVRRALIRYARWLRERYEFPIRVPVYLFPTETIVTIHGKTCAASFFAPFDRRAEPHIRIATGDYPALKKKSGRDNALAAFIVSLNHELVHYYQWLSTGKNWEQGVDRKASRMLQHYADSVAHP
jgi:hypothetical protein